MATITPHLWYSTEAVEAANFYVSVFPDSKIVHTSQIKDTPSGDCDIVSFTVMGQAFMAISAGPIFTLNPSISFMVNFDPSIDPEAEKNIETTWEKLADGGQVLMPLDEYPFSKRYGWIQDKFGLSWQLILTDPTREPRPPVLPALLFVNDMCGKAEEASDFYISVFRNAKRGAIEYYGANQEPNKEGNIMFTDFMLENSWFVAMDGALEHKFAFNEAVYFIVSCDTQAEIDYYWEKLSAVPEAEQCGWLKDAYGVSWQIVPTVMNKMMQSGNQAKIDAVTQAFLQMKKFDIAALQKAYDSEG